MVGDVVAAEPLSEALQCSNQRDVKAGMGEYDAKEPALVQDSEKLQQQHQPHDGPEITATNKNNEKEASNAFQVPIKVEPTTENHQQQLRKGEENECIDDAYRHLYPNGGSSGSSCSHQTSKFERIIPSKHSSSSSSSCNALKHVIGRTDSAPSLAVLQQYRKLWANNSNYKGLTPSPSLSDSMTKSISTANIATVCNQSSPKRSLCNNHRIRVPKVPTTKRPNSLGDIPPKNMLWLIMKRKGFAPTTYPALSMTDFFLPVLPEHIAAYDMEIVRAVRNEDIDTLNDIARRKKSLQCCNRFGESIVHTACRRGSVKVLNCLLENNVQINVTCDSGRTPLHDFCWTAKVNFELLRVILSVCPDFLYIVDQRNLAPLAYISSSEQWEDWNRFLLSNHKLLVPKNLELLPNKK